MQKNRKNLWKNWINKIIYDYLTIYFSIMKKITLTILTILFTFYLSWCSSDWANEKDDDKFKKNMECSKLWEEWIKFAKEFYWDKTQVKTIFYSPERESCLIVAYTIRNSWKSNIYILDIMDILTRESIYWVDSQEMFLYKDVIDWNCLWLKEDKCKLFNDKMKELKWE